MVVLSDHTDASDVVTHLAAVVSTPAGTDRTGHALRVLPV